MHDDDEVHDHDRGLTFDLSTILNRRRFLFGVAGTGALAVLAAACGGRGGSSAASGATTTAAATATRRPPPGAVAGLRVGADRAERRRVTPAARRPRPTPPPA